MVCREGFIWQARAIKAEWSQMPWDFWERRNWLIIFQCFHEKVELNILHIRKCFGGRVRRNNFFKEHYRGKVRMDGFFKFSKCEVYSICLQYTVYWQKQFVNPEKEQGVAQRHTEGILANTMAWKRTKETFLLNIRYVEICLNPEQKKNPPLEMVTAVFKIRLSEQRLPWSSR